MAEQQISRAALQKGDANLLFSIADATPSPSDSTPVEASKPKKHRKKRSSSKVPASLADVSSGAASAAGLAPPGIGEHASPTSCEGACWVERFLTIA